MLSEKVIAILADKTMRAQMSRKSLDIIKDHDIDKVVEKYESVYHKIINR